MAADVTLEQYAELEHAERDRRVLEESGLHPSIHERSHGTFPPDAPDAASEKILVLCVPQGEAEKAIEILEARWESEIAQAEEYDK